ncbi:MAG: FAD-binding oxidoreductase, partial [Chitinophagaceae bacterium]
DNGDLIDDVFDFAAFSQDQSGVRYKEITAGKVIFCDGIAGATNPFFQILPFGPNKGEAVLVEISELPRNHIYKKGFSLVPWKDNLFWLGSNYLWEFEDDSPTPGFYRFAENWLKQTVRVPFQIVDHFAGVRPATLERRPFVGFHPVHPNVGIFNGMGTKGCSLAPFFAKQFVQLISTGTGLYREADVKRFERVLSRG